MRAEHGGAPSRAERLAQVSVFADLKSDSRALERLASLMTERGFAPGHDIITEGETGTEMFVLIEGDAAVLKRTPSGDEYKVAILRGEQCAMVGEGGLIQSDQRSATIRAEGACRCLVLDRKHFDAFSGEHPEWALPIFKRIAAAVMARLHKTNTDLLLLYNALVAEIRG